MATRVGIVILGDEVLKGEIREANLAHMIPLLAEWGAETALCAILPDDVPVVVRHLRRFREEVDFLVLTGDRKSTRLNSSHLRQSRMPSSA